ncbi:MAG: SDR family oxidoreductase [Myxococcota bacterium]|nr:SDR family oxidoreductase [Myxococcota bacterium]
MIDLTNRVALVTGGSRGIGRSIALKLAEAGADVLITYLNAPADAQEVAGEIMALGRKTLVLKADLSEEEDIKHLVDTVNEHFGELDILVSNAAGGGFRPAMNVSTNNFEYAMNLNARAFMLLMQEAAPLLKRSPDRPGRAKAISISSFGAVRALPMYGAIGATKAALEALTRHFALELGNDGINVNCIRAGVVDTGAIRSLPNAEELLQVRAQRSLADNRNVTPDDVAKVALFLASELSDMVQGETVVVDGGTSLHP